MGDYNDPSFDKDYLTEKPLKEFIGGYTYQFVSGETPERDLGMWTAYRISHTPILKGTLNGTLNMFWGRVFSFSFIPTKDGSFKLTCKDINEIPTNHIPIEGKIIHETGDLFIHWNNTDPCVHNVVVNYDYNLATNGTYTHNCDLG